MHLFPRIQSIVAIAGVSLVGVVPVGAQSTLIDLRDLAPRQVKTEAFSLPAAQDVQIDATGAESTSGWGQFTWVRSIWRGNPREPLANPWTGNAWILNLETRKVVWELSSASTSRGAGGARTFSGSVRLAAGSYAAYYSAFPDGEYWSDDGKPKSDRKWHWFGDEPIGDFKIVVRGSGQRLGAADVERLRRASDAAAIVSLKGASGEQFLQAGFALSRPTEIDVYAVGEAREDGEFDYGWIINADTRAKVWKLSWHDSDPAGGAQKNRTAKLARTLPAGRYAAFYATDDSHDPSEWNAPPPHDPDAWGLTISVNDSAARSAVTTFAYELVPANATILALTRIGDGESRTQGFTLTRPMEIRVYALGEGRNGQMFDYGWITSGETHKRVWEMRYNNTEGAGGDPKNRLADANVRLDRGSYMVHYVSDGSHSADGWNASAPPDGRHWGITILAAQGPLDRSAIGPYAEAPDPSIVAQLTEIRDNDQVRKRFTLDRDTDIRIHAIGEGTGRDMDDYGWIEDAKTGRRVWEMTYRMTEHAGGAEKNRRFEGTIKLPAGEYILRYETDGSHSFGDWNAAPPDEPEMWGITLYRAR